MSKSGKDLIAYGFALCYFATAIAAFELTQGADGIAAVWPPSGILIAGLLLFERPQRHRLVIGAAIASMAANLLAGAELLEAFGYTIANLIEGFLVFYLMAGHVRSARLSDPLTLLRFGGASLIGGCASAAMAALLSFNFDLEFLTSWGTTVTLGMLVVTPVIVFLAENRRGRNRLPSLRALWALLVVAGSTLAAFGQSELPLLFLPVVGVSLATYLLGLSGTAVAMLVVAAVGSILTGIEAGPLPMYFSSTQAQVLFFQAYLVGLLISALPLATLLDQRRNALTDLRESQSLLESAERAANVGHWRYRIADRSTYWSKQARRIALLEGSASTDLIDALAMYHPDDRERIRGLTIQAIRHGVPFVFEARVPQPDGQIVFVEGRGSVETDENGKTTSLFGTLLDVTERVLSLRKVEDAHARAERETVEVRRLAETDHLTGVFNRGKVMEALDSAVAGVEGSDGHLSIAMVDIDHFKSINDRFGHAAGDAALTTVAKILQRHMRENDTLGRIGGEEFLLVLPGADIEDAAAMAEVCRAALAKHDWAEEGMPQVTLSIGVAAWRSGSAAHEMLRTADLALYEAKNTGRNRVVTGT